jgi:hypothetical protein
MSIEAYTRTAQEVIEAVTRQVGDEAEIQFTQADIIRWINQGQLEISIKNSTINEASAVTNIVSGQDKYPILTDVAFADLNKLQTILYDGRPLKNLTFSEAMDYIIDGDSDSGTPTIWYVKTGVLNLWPKPDKAIAGGLTIYYNKRPKKITSAGDILGVPDSFFNAVLQYVIAQAMELDENYQAAGVKLQQFEVSVNSQQYMTVEQSASYPTIQTDPEDFI